MSELQTRTFEIEFREDSDEGTFEGIAVPWDQTITVGGKFKERFKRGSIDPTERISLYRDHKALIGHVESAEDREEGLWVKARVALSDIGRDTLALLRSGSLRSLSVGFVPVTDEQDGDVIVRARVSLREVSVVERPAYSLANVLTIREENTDLSVPIERNTVDNAENQGLVEVRNEVEELSRRFDSFTPVVTPSAPAVDHRSAGEVLKALVSGDKETFEAVSELQARAYTGGTTADAPLQTPWVADLTRIFDASSGVLSQVFETGTLPAEGNNIEFVELVSNTVQFNRQAAEGDDLAYGKVTFTTRTAPVHTFGGYVQLTRQQIERSSLPVLNRSLEALAVAAAARKKVELRTAFVALVAARTAIATNGGVVVLGSTLGASAAGNWEDALIDAALRYELEDSAPEALIVSASVFKRLRSLTIVGERVFQVGNGNASGTLNLPGMTGNLAGLPVYLDAGHVGDSAVFVNGRAIRQYDSGMVSLQDENIINLSKDFSAYRYGAIAAEVPQFVVPIKLAAS
jgi:hypothetical protein